MGSHHRSDREIERFFPGESELAGLMRALDWSRTDPGPPEEWPENLRIAVSLCLTSRIPIVMYWGPNFTVLYNDPYISFLGKTKHPRYLGQPGEECWREIWETIGPMFKSVYATGKATWSEDVLMFFARALPLEEVYVRFTFGPILAADGRTVEGIFCPCTETTERVVGERRLETLRRLGTRAAEVRTLEAACEEAAAVLSENPRDIPFAAIYVANEPGTEATIAASAGLDGAVHLLPPSVSPVDDAPLARALASVLRTQQPEESPALDALARQLPGRLWPEPANQAVALPIPGASHDRLAGLLVLGVSPRRVLDDAYRTFFNLVAGHIGTAIAEARAYEEERKRAEALAELDRAKTAFFSNVSHEFRTPLTLMLGPVSDLLAKPEEGVLPESREQLEVVHRNGQRLLKLVNTLLDFARIEAGRAQAVFEPTDLAGFTAELASNFRSACERAGLRLVVDCPPLPEPIHVDREMWEKIVLNLLSNAFKFTLEGEIAVTLRLLGSGPPLDAVFASSGVFHPVEGSVALTVRDTGTGIPEQELPHLFERFHRVKGARGRTQEGTGIGLALVQELAKLHGGSIRVESAVERGSTFTVSVPRGSAHLPPDRIQGARTLASTALGAAPYVEEALRWIPEALAEPDSPESVVVGPGVDPATASPIDGEASRPRVLLADDNTDMRDYVRRLLGARYDVEAVSDGQAALDRVRRRLPDLVVSDVMMPQLDGFGLLRALRADERTSTLPVILLSARAGEEARVEGLDQGADDYLTKPFSARDLLASVSARLEIAHGRARHSRQLQELAATAVAINAPLSVEDALQVVTARARAIIGAHQSVTSMTVDLSGKQTVSAGSISEKYAQWQEYEERFDAEGLAALVCRSNRTIRLTQEEVEKLPEWRRYREDLPLRPPLRGWLAAPLIRRDGGNLGLIHLSDKNEGEFTEADESILTQLAQTASVAIENAQFFVATQEARAEAEAANRMKDHFLATLSHELRTPLNAILGWARMLQSGRVDAATIKQGLETIERNSKVQAQLIEDLLDLSRIISGKLRLDVQRVAVAETIEAALAAVAPAADAKEIRIQRILDPLAGPVSGDPARLQQVVWNLLANAVKFTPKGGRIQVLLERVNSHVEISVIDTGQGMKPEFLPFVFDRFRQADSSTTRHHSGLGLGLSIVRQLVEMHGGTVRAKSPGEGKGATFTVSLPITIVHEPSAERVGPKPPPAGELDGLGISLRGVKVLVVDDEPDARELIQRILVDSQAEVITAESVSEALRTVAQEKPDVILSDIGMPDQDGYDLIRQVRARGTSAKELPAVALTAFARPEDRRRALMTGFQVHVPKPVDPDELVAVVGGLVGRTAAGETRKDS